MVNMEVMKMSEGGNGGFDGDPNQADASTGNPIIKRENPVVGIIKDFGSVIEHDLKEDFMKEKPAERVVVKQVPVLVGESGNTATKPVEAKQPTPIKVNQTLDKAA